MTAAPATAGAPLPSRAVREAVRDLLLSAASYHQLPSEERRDIAQAMTKVCQAAVSLLQEEAHSEEIAAGLEAPKRPPALSLAQNAGSEFSGVSAQRVAGTTQSILNAVSFPRFVTELINGVFKAMIDSNQQQMNSYVELIKNVAATTEGFADMNLAPARARQWLVETFPGSFELEGGPEADTEPRDKDDEPDAPGEVEERRVRMKSGGSMPSEAALRSALGLAPEESVPSGDPETTLVPYARRALARQRQQMLGTMVMLGMQRIVIESGRLNAAMRFHIDTRSAANSEDASRFDFQNQLEASGKFGMGPWGAEAKMTNTIGYVSTQKNQTSEEMNTDLDLNSSVELYFKTDYLPLDRLAGKGQVDRIKVNTLNPDAEEEAARKSRDARTSAARAEDSKRMASLDVSPQRPPSPPASPQPAPSPPAKPAAAAPSAPATRPGGAKAQNPRPGPAAQSPRR